MSTILQDVANIVTCPTERVNNFSFPTSRQPWEQRERVFDLRFKMKGRVTNGIKGSPRQF